MKIMSPTCLKQRVGAVLDAAVKGHPQFVLRGGSVVMLSRLDIEIENRPPGYFAAAYARPNRERDALEVAMSRIPQKAER